MTSRSCSRVWQVEALRDGRISDAEAVAVRSHLERCGECARENEQLDALSRRLNADRSDLNEMSLRRLRYAILAKADAELRGGPERRWRRFPFAAAVMAALAIVFGVWAIRRPAGPPSQEESVAVIAGQGARFSRTMLQGSEFVDLAEGALSISTSRRFANHRFVVRVPDGEVEDIGTVFKVEVREGRTREISVSEGVVIFRRPGSSDVRLVTGSAWTEPPASEPATAIAVPIADSEPMKPTPDVGPRPTVHPPKRRPANGAANEREASAEPVSPQPPNEDESYLRIVALLREGRADEAHVAALQYLRRFPDGFRRTEVERLASPNAR